MDGTLIGVLPTIGQTIEDAAGQPLCVDSDLLRAEACRTGRRASGEPHAGRKRAPLVREAIDDCPSRVPICRGNPAGLPRGSFGFQLQHGRTLLPRRARLEFRAGGLPLDSEKRNDPPGKPAAFCARRAAPG